MALPRKILLIALVIVSALHTISGAEEKNKTTTTAIPTTSLSTTIAPTTSESPSNITTTDTPTSSAIPKTSTAPPPKTSTAPPHKKDNMWVVKDSKGRTCIVAQMKISLDIPYNNTYSKKVVKAQVIVPGQAEGSGSCNISDPKANQTLVLQWGSPNYTNVLTLTFASNVTSKEFWIDSISAVISVDNHIFPNISSTIKQVKLVNNTKHFITPLDNSYNCPDAINVPGKQTPIVANHTAYFVFDHFQLQAFKNATNDNFSSAIYCKGDNTPDLVPILVGCMLIGLVVIVLGVYLWGRRRSQQRGYLSM